MELYTNYDFVPGDKVIFYDDFSREETGEFPSRWRLVDGVFEIARKGDKNWVLCTDQGKIIPDIENLDLPGDLHHRDGDLRQRRAEHAATGTASSSSRGTTRRSTSSSATATTPASECFDRDVASKKLPNQLTKGRHTMRIMVTRTTIKCYVDAERVGNVPKPDGFDPDDVQVYLDPYEEPGNPMLMGTLPSAPPAARSCATSSTRTARSSPTASCSTRARR